MIPIYFRVKILLFKKQSLYYTPYCTVKNIIYAHSFLLNVAYILCLFKILLFFNIFLGTGNDWNHFKYRSRFSITEVSVIQMFFFSDTLIDVYALMLV